MQREPAQKTFARQVPPKKQKKYAARQPRGTVTEKQLPEVREAWLQACPFEDMFTTAVDPGVTDWIYAAQKGDSPGQHRAWSLNTAEYMEQCGYSSRERWMDKRLKAAPSNLHDWQSNLPSSKTADVAKLVKRVRYITKRLPEILEHYTERPQRARRWKVNPRLPSASLRAYPLLSSSIKRPSV